MARILIKDIASLDWEAISHMKLSETRAYLKEARKYFQTKESQFEGRYSNVYSQAYEHMKSFYQSDKSTRDIAISKIRKSPAQKELYRLSKFFEAKSSSVQGARKVATEQDIRVFGEKSPGKPARRMTKKQRESFWALYDEYLNTYKTADSMYGSGKIQQFLGNMVRSTKGGVLDVNAKNIENLNTLLKKHPFKAISDRADSYANVLSGKWNFNER